MKSCEAQDVLVLFTVINLLFQVCFATPVSIAQHPKINEWLTYVEKEMRVTLAKLLAQAIKDVTVFKSGKINSEEYLEWVDKYQVTNRYMCNLTLRILVYFIYIFIRTYFF